MIKSLRKRFILTVMQAFLTVLVLVLVGVNLVNRRSVYAELDARLDFLGQSSMGPPIGMVASTPWEIRSWVDLNSAGIMNETSYFIFSGTMQGPILTHQLEMLSAASGRDAAELLEELLSGSANAGNVGSYRYHVVTRQAPYRVVFLNCETEFSAMRSLWRSSLLVGLVSLLLVLALVTLLSGHAIRPFEQNIQNQRRFISNASHELKTPLGVIVSDLDIQMMESGRTEWLENAQQQADHLSLLIDRLSAYSLLSEKRPGTAADPVDLSLLAEAAAADFRPLARVRSQTLAASIQPGVTVTGDPDALRTLLSVLLDNAVKYAPEGGAIELSLRKERRAVLEVKSTRSPEDDLELDRVFERFYRAPARRADENGHGLGLSIAQEIAVSHGGTLRARDDGDAVAFIAEL